MKLPHQDNPPFPNGSLVYIRPGSFEQDDDQPYIVMGHSRSLGFGKWTVSIVPADNQFISYEHTHEDYLTDQPPYDNGILGYYRTGNGVSLALIRGGLYADHG